MQIWYYEMQYDEHGVYDRPAIPTNTYNKSN
jgi:hypothetical protein